MAKLLLVVASHFRDRAIRGSASMIEEIRKSQRQHPKLLLKMWNAIEAGQQSAYEEALVSSLEYTVKQYPDASSFYELRRFLAWPESILLLIAEREGLSLPELPMRLSDRLLTSDWR